MTSYSLYGTSRLQLVDGSLSTDEELAHEQLDQLISCVAAGAMRALLDSARDESEAGLAVYAEQWHSEEEGWELDALTDEERPGFLDVVGRFVRENLMDVLTLSQFIAWDPTTSGQVWHGNDGMGVYRVGYLFGMQANGQGIGFFDYAYPRTGTVTRRLSDWLDAHTRAGHLGEPGQFWWQDAYVDSDEEPCLLHLSA